MTPDPTTHEQVMTLSKMTGLALGSVLGCILTIIGVYLSAGLPGLLVAVGVIVALACLLLSDVGDPAAKRARREQGPTP